MKEELLSMKIGDDKDFVFSGGVLKSTKNVCRISEEQWEIHCFSSGWKVATLNLEETENYLTGKLSPFEIEWN
jgi:hypothetical protein